MNSYIALHGSYYGDNFGDTLFIKVFVEWLKEIRPEIEQELLLPYASERARRTVNVSAIRGIRALLKCKCLVFMGGGYFGEPRDKAYIWHIRLIVRHLSIVYFARVFRKPYIFIGLGAGPLTNCITRRMCVAACNRSKGVLVRDVESRNYLVEYGVRPEKITVTADSILGLKSYRKSVANDKLKIGIHLPMIHMHPNIEQVVKEIAYFASEHEGCEMYAFKDFYKETFQDASIPVYNKYLGQENYMYMPYQSPTQLIQMIGDFDIVITNKLHCGIVALTQGTFVCSVAFHSKTQRLYDQLNLSKYTIPIDKYQEGKLLDMLSDYGKVIQIIPDDILEKVQWNKQKLEEFVYTYYDE